METKPKSHNGAESAAWPEAVEARLQELRRELHAGETQLEELDRRRALLRDTMLRISGAIQVLEEMQHARALPAAIPEALRADA